MKNNKLLDTLKDLGLSENEAKVYFAALSLGPAAILKIARAAEIKRTTVYSVVEALKNKGLMNIEIKGWKKLFVAENPEQLESMINTRREKLKNTLPEFAALYNLKGGESVIKYYEGLEAVKGVYENLLKTVRPHEDYMVIVAQEPWYKVDEGFIRDFAKRRAKLNINVRMIMRASEVAQEFKKYEKNYNAKIKIIPKGTTLSTNAVIIPERLVLNQLSPPIMSIVIESKSIIQMHQELFEIVWHSIKD
jgi:sugar-specific transcriptional regulator TrmB